MDKIVKIRRRSAEKLGVHHQTVIYNLDRISFYDSLLKHNDIGMGRNLFIMEYTICTKSTKGSFSRL